MAENSKQAAGLDPKILGQIMSAIGKTSKTPAQVVEGLPTELPASNTKKKSIFDGLGDLLGKVAPIAAGFIPGVGPIASQLLSTLNDDEWYEKYASSGAAFNELLVTRLVDGGLNGAGKPKLNVIPRAAFAFVQTGIAIDVKARETWEPSTIAYIREKTQNVLVDDTSKYGDAIIAGAKILALYFTIEKYVRFAQKQPLNIPRLTDLIVPIKPGNLNTFIGIRDSLKQYIQSTVRLPYALTEAIRWRFGTSFHSFNTGQPGYIMYDFIDFTTVPTVSAFNVWDSNYLTLVTTEISVLQNLIMGTGRAMADVRLAYVDHAQRLDVEDPHYDEKEFNLRLNLTSYLQGSPYGGEMIELIKDSRLAQSPAIQASTLSTSNYASTGYNFGGHALFPVGGINLATFVFNESIAYPTVMSAHSPFRYYLKGLLNIDPVGTYANQWTVFDIGHNAHYGLIGAQTSLLQQTSATSSNFELGDMTGGISYFFNALGAELLLDSLGFDHRSLWHANTVHPFTTPDNWIEARTFADRISYDYARINPSALVAVQTAALRNLFRGDYKNKSADTVTLPAVKEMVVETVEAMTPAK